MRCADGVPAEAGLEVDGGRHREPGADVARPLELEEADARRRAVVVAGVRTGGLGDLADGVLVGVVAPRDVERLEAVLVAGADDQEARTRGSEQPLVEIAGVEVRAHVVDVEGDHRGGVGAIHHGHDAAAAGLGTDLLRGKHQTRGREDVAEEEHASSRRKGRAPRRR